jgi:hypothetical protein
MNTVAFAYVVRKVTNRGDIARAWGRLTVTRRGRLELTAARMAAVPLIGVGFEVSPAIADARKLSGMAVPDDELSAVVAAATPYPMLPAPRVAAQLMSLTRVHHQRRQADDVRSPEGKSALLASLRD